MRRGGRFGRRKSDWFIPIGLALIIGLAMGWALDNRAKSEEIARLSQSLQNALELSAERAPADAGPSLPHEALPPETTPSETAPPPLQSTTAPAPDTSKMP